MTARPVNILRVAAKKVVEDLTPTLQQTQFAALLGRTGKLGLRITFEPVAQAKSDWRDAGCRARVAACVTSRGDVAIRTSRDGWNFVTRKTIPLADPDSFEKVHGVLRVLLQRDARRLWVRAMRQRFWAAVRASGPSDGETEEPSVKCRCVFRPTGPSIAFADSAGAIWYQGGTSRADVLTAALAYVRQRPG